MFSISIGQYTLSCNSHSLPDLYSSYVEHAQLVEEFDLWDDGGERCFLALGLSGADWPFLVLAQGYDPSGGFHPGALLVEETGILFVGVRERLLAYALDPPARLWIDSTYLGFWGWARHGDTILMSAELELAAWDIDGRKLWSTFVEPPWHYLVSGDVLDLDVMGKRTSFSIGRGPGA